MKVVRCCLPPNFARIKLRTLSILEVLRSKDKVTLLFTVSCVRIYLGVEFFLVMSEFYVLPASLSLGTKRNSLRLEMRSKGL